jgi:hypothetical protein
MAVKNGLSPEGENGLMAFLKEVQRRLFGLKSA